MNKKSFLLDTLEYYTADVRRRCKNNNKCAYSPVTADKENISEGCAIGRYLSPELQLELDEGNYSVSNRDVFLKLPQEMKNLGMNYLSSIQSLHDTDSNWDVYGLSSAGKQYLGRVLENYNINKEEFNKYLN